MNKKLNLLFVFSISLLFSTQTAYADFHKALDAYIARDGATMLSEVKDAVNKKSDDGLALFLSAMNIDASTSRQADIARIWRGDSDKHYIPESQVKTTLSVILTELQQNELFNALQWTVDNSSVDTQYDFAVLQRTFKRTQQKDWLKMQDDYAQKGSYAANLTSGRSLAIKAELGDPVSQMSLGLKYLNFTSDWGYGCWETDKTKDAICQNKDEIKGYYWLKQALITYESKRHIFFGDYDTDSFGIYADTMCDFFHKTANGDKNKLRQAYLWCVVGINSGGQSSWRFLNEMNEAGNLKIAAPETKAFWSKNAQEREKRFEPLILTDFKELPYLMIEVKKELQKEDLPVFSYYFSDYRMSPYLLDIYADGRVNIIFSFLPDRKSDLFTKVSSKTVQNFLKDLKKLDFDNWTLFTSTFQFCDNFDPCIWTYAQATHREGNDVRKVKIREPAYLAELSHNNVSTLRVAKLNSLVEQYFPTQKIRCEIGNSEGFRKACMERDKRWAALAKETLKDKK